ncbi:MAG: class II aldolase/adducin family protein [Dehalococcoidia bacterium]
MATTEERRDQSGEATGWTRERQQVLEAAVEMYRAGLVIATSGNVSARCGEELMAITASGKDYEHLTQDDVVVVDFDGEPILGDAIPSTELLMHAAIYRSRREVGAVVHTHSVHASALAVAGIPLPPIVDEMVVTLGDSVQVSEYAFPSSGELGDNVVVALGERSAALIRNHGVVGVGRDPKAALGVCRLVERLAHIYTLASAIGTPKELAPEVVASELELFRMRQEVEENA